MKLEKSTINTFLYAKKSSESKAEKLCDITSYPDLFATPEMLDVSDMSSRYKKYAEGMADVLNSPFGANYTKAAYEKIKSKQNAIDAYTKYLEMCTDDVEIKKAQDKLNKLQNLAGDSDESAGLIDKIMSFFAKK